jgi:hypothetical protein
VPAQWFVSVRATYQDTILGYLCQHPDVVLAVILQISRDIKRLAIYTPIH